MDFTDKRKLREIGYILFRNIFFPTNGLLSVVVVLLIIFGDALAGLFVGIVLVLNIILMVVQGIQSWSALEKLQSLTAPRSVRLTPEGGEETVLAEQIEKGDLIKLRTGDQVPCDGELFEIRDFEVNQGLVTGESESLAKNKGDHLLAGSVVTAGSGLMKSETVFAESRIARMTAGIKAYSINTSPIQRSVETVIKYTAYLSLAAIAFVVVRGYIIHEPILRVIKVIGSIAAVFIPQGVVLAVTIFFAYGAVKLFREKVLLQEVNATEKLGRIKNLCMDKTGTLTKNELNVEDVFLPVGMTKDKAETLVSAYLAGSSDSSEIIQAVKKFVRREYDGKIIDDLPFSSWRQYGAVRAESKEEKYIIFAGLPDYFMAHIFDERERQWLQKIVESHAHLGKRVLCFFRSSQDEIPNDLSGANLSVVAAFIFYNALRDGIQKTIDFFQERGVRIRIISGDNSQTAQAIAKAAGIRDSDRLITGKELEKWNDADLEKNIGSFSVFAQILPEQKEKIITAFKKTGFTAMVGDGANDALAIKKADLGIAMFDGAAATRHIASVILTNNSFEALPGGVALADVIIRSIEIFASIFFNMSAMGIFLFAIMAVFGREYPFTPLNIPLINYFTIGMPGILLSYWTIRPSGKVQPEDERPFLKRILPFTIACAVFQALGGAVIFALSPRYLKMAESNTLIVLSFIIFGFLFFILAPKVYGGILSRWQKFQLLILGVVEAALLLMVFHVQFFSAFFEINPLHLAPLNIGEFVMVVVAVCSIQYLIAKRLFGRAHFLFKVF